MWLECERDVTGLSLLTPAFGGEGHYHSCDFFLQPWAEAPHCDLE